MLHHTQRRALISGMLPIISSKTCITSKASWLAWYKGQCSLMCILAHTHTTHPLHSTLRGSYWLTRRVKRKDGLLRDERWSRWILLMRFSWSAEIKPFLERRGKQSCMHTQMCTCTHTHIKYNHDRHGHIKKQCMLWCRKAISDTHTQVPLMGPMRRVCVSHECNQRLP